MTDTTYPADAGARRICSRCAVRQCRPRSTRHGTSTIRQPGPRAPRARVPRDLSHNVYAPIGKDRDVSCCHRSLEQRLGLGTFFANPQVQRRRSAVRPARWNRVAASRSCFHLALPQGRSIAPWA